MKNILKNKEFWIGLATGVITTFGMILLFGIILIGCGAVTV